MASRVGPSLHIHPLIVAHRNGVLCDSIVCDSAQVSDVERLDDALGGYAFKRMKLGSAILDNFQTGTPELNLEEKDQDTRTASGSGGEEIIRIFDLPALPLTD